MGETKRDLLIIGCGYSGRAIARLALSRGLSVTGTCAHREHLGQVAQSGAEPLLLELGNTLADDARRRELVNLVARHRYLVLSVGPERLADSENFVDHTADLVSAIGNVPLDAVVYLSSTGIYGNRDGAWVDETSPLKDDVGPRGGCRKVAEAALLTSNLPTRVLRLAGIYGPGRHIGLRMAGGRYRVIEADPPLVVNRIHVDDLAQATLAALDSGRDREIYLLADGVPATLREVADYAAGLMGLPSPEGEPVAAAKARMGDANFHLVADRKRCRNDKLIHDLGVALKYPSYREGLQQALASDGLLAG